MQALMLDSNRDVRPLLGHLGLTGCVAVCRPLFAGATAPDGSVPDPVAAPLTADEASGIRAAGLAVMVYDNGIGWGDLAGAGAAANGARKASAAIAAMQSLGFPPGCYCAGDLEGWDVDPAFASPYCAAWRSSEYGGAGWLYFGAASPFVSTWRQMRATDENVARALLWIARYPGPWSGTPRAWDPGVDDPAVAAWQFADDGPGGVDLSILRLPLLSVGTATEGIWLADGTVGSPKAPDVLDALGALDRSSSALGAASAALSAAAAALRL